MKVTLLAAFIPLLGTTIDQCQAVLGKVHQCLNQYAHCVLYTILYFQLLIKVKDNILEI